MTSETREPTTAYVWVWLPNAADPVVAGSLTETGDRLSGEPVLGFVYARSYREREDAISLFTPELPLRPGTFDPSRPAAAATGANGTIAWRGWPAPAARSPLPLAGCLRDAAPDTWGRRVINQRVAGDRDVQLGELTYLTQAGSDRVGALDVQASPTSYVPRGGAATLAELMSLAERVERGLPIPDDLAVAAIHGTSIGGARPKALLTDDAGRGRVAKFSSTTDVRPVVRSEAVGMLMAARIGIDVPRVEVAVVDGRDVLLVDRFDRTATGTRRMVVSGLTVLGLREEEARYATYVDLARAIRHPGWSDSAAQLRELYTRMVLNVAVSNTDDHLRNHAAFWDGTSLRLTPAYDIAPQPRSTQVASHAIGLLADGTRFSQLWVAREAAPEFLLDRHDADAIIDLVVQTIEQSWHEVCDEARLTRAERERLWGRELLNPYVFYDQP